MDEITEFWIDILELGKMMFVSKLAKSRGVLLVFVIEFNFI